MLRVSAKKNEVKVDIQGVNGNEEAAGLGVEFGVELMKFAESLALDDEETLAIARERLLEESIDVMKFLLGLMIVNGFSLDDIYSMFKQKSKVVEKRL